MCRQVLNMKSLLIVDPIGVLTKIAVGLLLLYLVGRFILGRRNYD